MWLPVALAAWGHALLHSISHQVYTCNIPGIYLVYANKNVIYQVYAWYILMGKSIYEVYTWYISCINLSYDDIQYIPDIHLLKTFWDISVPVTLRYGHGIYQVYTWFILGICYVHTVTGQVPKCHRKFWVGVRQVYTLVRHMTGLCMVNTRYIPCIYFYPLVYTQYIPGIWHFIGIYHVYTRYMTGIYRVADAVEEDMVPCRQSHRQSHHRALSLL